MEVTKKIDIGGNSLPVDEFKIESMLKNPAICMIAKRASGKSWVCRAILNHFKYIPVGVIIAPTDKLSCFYGDFFPSTYIYYTYDSEILQKLLARQQKMVEKAILKYKEGKKCDPRSILLMDDCLSEKGKWLKDQPILEMFYNGRHYQIMFILTMQFPLGIGPALRGNFDYIFLLCEDFLSNQKRLFEHYAGMFPNFDTFRQVFMELTKNHGSMVISNRGAGETFLSKIHWFKAKKIKIKKMGCKQFNDFHDKNFDPEWMKKEQMFNIENIKKGTKIRVDKKINKTDSQDSK